MSEVTNNIVEFESLGNVQEENGNTSSSVESNNESNNILAISIASAVSAAIGFAGGTWLERRNNKAKFKLVQDLVQEIISNNLGTGTGADIMKVRDSIIQGLENKKISEKESLEWQKLLNNLVTAVHQNAIQAQRMVIEESMKNEQ